MTKTDNYLPFPLFLLTLAVVGLSSWYLYKTYGPVPTPIDINAVTTNNLAPNATSACLNKSNNAVCSYQYCPPCATGATTCSQTEMTCHAVNGFCINNNCSINGLEAELTFDQNQNAPPTKTITLTSSPLASNQFTNKLFELELRTADVTDKLTGVKLELDYDPTKLTIEAFNPTDYLPNLILDPVFSAGKLIVTLGAPPESGGRSAGGVVGKITIKPITLGDHTITFSSSTMITTVNTAENGLKSTTPITFTAFNLGDINVDKIVDLKDYNLFVPDYGQEIYGNSDLFRDGVIDLKDYNLFVQNFGKVSP